MLLVKDISYVSIIEMDIKNNPEHYRSPVLDNEYVKNIAWEFVLNEIYIQENGSVYDVWFSIDH